MFSEISARDAAIFIRDEGPGFDHVGTLPDVWSESGRGLFLIEELSDGMTIERLPGRGTHTDVVLRLRSAV